MFEQMMTRSLRKKRIAAFLCIVLALLWTFSGCTKAEEPAGEPAPAEQPQTAEAEQTPGAAEMTEAPAETVPETPEQPEPAPDTAQMPESTPPEQGVSEPQDQPDETVPEPQDQPEQTALEPEQPDSQSAETPADPEPEEAPPQESAVPAVYISISCETALASEELDDAIREVLPADGCILPNTRMEISEGDSVFDLLKHVCEINGIAMEFSKSPVYDSAYIEGIGHLYEFDCGNLSGWEYSVNGWYPNYGCSKAILQDGDVICWKYTCDLGKDIGAN